MTPTPLTKDYILQRLREEGSKHGFISTDRWRQMDLKPSTATIYKHFDSWQAAWQAADITQSTTPQEIINTMQAVKTYQSQIQWTQAGRHPGVRTIIRYFGSWKAAWEAAGISPGPVFAVDNLNWHRLTPTQQKVLTYLSEGKTQVEIAKLLGVSPQWIQQSRDSAIYKLHKGQ